MPVSGKDRKSVTMKMQRRKYSLQQAAPEPEGRTGCPFFAHHSLRGNL